MRIYNRVLACIVLACAMTRPAASIGYFQTNLTSDIPGLANNFDPLLVNPWGMSFSATSPFWVSDQGSATATLYNGAGVPNALIVSIPPVPGPGPTGQVFAGGAGFTTMAGASPNFIFSTLAGTIDAWNAGASAIVQFTATDGAVYTGLGRIGNVLYAADNHNGKIDVFNSTFQKVASSGFVDPNVPAGFTPYNIENVGGNLYVEYSHGGQPGGFIGVFDANGVLLQHISDPHLNAPWGVTLAPLGFGDFGGDLLVGNFGDGRINAFNPTTGAFLGTLSDGSGNPIVNNSLWAIEFRAPGSGFDSNALFFNAGINNQKNGLFGEIQVVPEPATLIGTGLALAACALARFRKTVG